MFSPFLFCIAGDDYTLVNVIKTSPRPLHHFDVVYEPPNDAGINISGKGVHGHFRHAGADVWDPHPEYLVGDDIRLQLRHDARFVGEDAQVSYAWKDRAHMRRLKPHEHSPCFYTGKVIGDDSSSVAVSLCGGMTGYIETTKGSYYIRPDGEGTQLHRITRIRHHASHVGCDTPGL